MIVLNYDFPFSGTTAIIWANGNLFAGIEFDFKTITGDCNLKYRIFKSQRTYIL